MKRPVEVADELLRRSREIGKELSDGPPPNAQWTPGAASALNAEMNALRRAAEMVVRVDPEWEEFVRLLALFDDFSLLAEAEAKQKAPRRP